MGLQVVRYLENGKAAWGVLSDSGVRHISGTFETLGEFLTAGGREAARASNGEAVPLASLRLLSPVTPDGDYICQAANYHSHVREIGRDPRAIRHNVFFHKASSSLSGPNDAIIRPAHVRLLDYEVELGLVVGRQVTAPIDPNAESLSDWIVGLVITNDVSARDIQVSHEQFNKAKSYRSFGPTGPVLWLATKDELKRWKDLQLTLKVNGSIRQHTSASDMIFGPVETLRELSQFRDLKPGDLIATGTPAGVALRVPPKALMFIGNFLSPAARFRAFLKGQLKNSRYLKPGDVIETRIATPDGAIDLGTQTNRVEAA